MNTPIYDFVKAYLDLRPARFHMPGHKGRGPLGCEELDLTEIPGTDSLYEASGIIAESEANASALFGCPTFYAVEGSSQCIKAMLLLAKQLHAVGGDVPDAPQVSARDAASGSRQPATGDGGCGSFDSAPLRSGRQMGKRFRMLAARNVHRAFLSAAALLDLDVVWLPTAAGSYLSAEVTPEALEAALAESGAGAVYLTCPDYLGKLPDLAPLARVCHAHGTLLLVDNAHGAYLRFLSPSRHPMDLGADLCCDSAHKTLPVLTGGAYLHAAASLGMRKEGVREALALFGSTSPSYLILQSLDLANPYLEALPEKLAAFLPRVEALKARLTAAGWQLTGDEPLKLTVSRSDAIKTSPACGRGGGPASRPVEGCLPPEALSSGLALAAALERAGIFCEFADPEHVVFMLTPENTDGELARLEAALMDMEEGSQCWRSADPVGSSEGGHGEPSPVFPPVFPERVCSIREALLAPAVTVPAAESLGRVLARPGVSCPPAVPILMPGERIDEAAAAAFARYSIRSVWVL